MATAHEHKVERIGRHLVEYEDELLHVHWASGHTQQERNQIYDLIETYIKSRDIALLLFDLRYASDLTREQRKASADWWRRQRLETIALAHYGLPKSRQIFVNMSTRAVGVLSGRTPQSVVLQTEADARTWLATIKPKLIAAYSALRNKSDV